MLDFSFDYKNFKISVYFSEYDNLFHAKCTDEGLYFCVVHDFVNKSDCFNFIPKLLAFIDILV